MTEHKLKNQRGSVRWKEDHFQPEGLKLPKNSGKYKTNKTIMTKRKLIGESSQKNRSQQTNEIGTEMELSAREKKLADRIEFLGSRNVNLQRNMDEAGLCQRLRSFRTNDIKLWN